ncbi:hypothetical protein BH11PSE5_BH11PSE5_10320 [soil metagenome]|uniref:Flp family type IVb pilin n=1 Tax=unclassified Sphingobium TaxID=2611147 RepID=UPI001E36C27F|nr:MULTISPECIES: Flp family type IVb pilin [unclassified Sphingobium]
MRNIIRYFTHSVLIRSQRGATAVEYGLICAMIVLAMLAALHEVATKSNAMWNNISAKVTEN